MNKRTLWWIIGSLGGLLILLIILSKTGVIGGNKGIKVAVEEAGAHDIVQTVSASGKIYPETEVKISPEVSGEITQLTVEEGDSVRAGELLVKINPAIYASIVNQAEAALQEARARVANTRDLTTQSQAQFEQAESNFKRIQKLYEDKVISAQEYEQALANYKSAEAAYNASRANVRGGGFTVEGARANLNQAYENLRRTTIVAPTSGIISQLKVKQGERVVGTAQMAGTEMLTIADMSRMEVRVDVSETDIAKVQIGDTTIINADAYRDRKFTGVVSKISVSSTQAGVAVSTDQVTNYTVHILILPESYADISAGLPKGQFPFKPGMSAAVEIRTKRQPNALSVPVNAVTTREWPDSVKVRKNTADVEDDIRQVVFVYDAKDNKVHIKDVETGIQDNQYIQITKGLKGGEKVVVAPYGAIARTLKEGSRVELTEKEKLFEVDKKED